MIDSARPSSRGRDEDGDSERDVDGIIHLESSPFRSETGKRSRATQEEMEDTDVFGSIRSPAGSSSSSTPLVQKNKGKGRMSGNSQAAASSGSGLRNSFLAPTPVRNDIPLFDDASDASGKSPLPLPPLGAAPVAREISQVVPPHMSKEEQAKYKYIGPKRVPSRSLGAPPTPPTTIPENHEDMGSASPQSPYEDYDDIFEDQNQQAGPSRTPHDMAEEEEEEEHQDDQPEDTDSHSRQLSSSRPPFEDEEIHNSLGHKAGHSSSDPIGMDWESRAGASEKPYGENEDDARDGDRSNRRGGSKNGNAYKDDAEMSGDEEDGEDDGMDDGDEDDSEDEEGGDSGRKKNLRNYDERREASKRTLKLRLRVPPREVSVFPYSVPFSFPHLLWLTISQSS